jgi:LacI family transcriptional regulator
MLAKLGYRRVGICLQEYFRGERDAKHAIAHYFSSRLPQALRVPPLFYIIKHGDSSQAKKMVQTWLSRHRPEVIVCHNNMVLSWVREAGFAVPDDVGIVHLATDDDVADWAGIHSNRGEIGAAAAEFLVSLINHRQVGVPAIDREIMIRGRWHAGWTLMERNIPRTVRSASGQLSV